MTDRSVTRQRVRRVAPTHGRVARLMAEIGLRSHPIGTGVERCYEIVGVELVVPPANEPRIGLVLA